MNNWAQKTRQNIAKSLRKYFSKFACSFTTWWILSFSMTWWHFILKTRTSPEDVTFLNPLKVNLVVIKKDWAVYVLSSEQEFDIKITHIFVFEEEFLKNGRSDRRTISVVDATHGLTSFAIKMRNNFKKIFFSIQNSHLETSPMTSS